ncbi:deoxyribodipyrimidine photo-lyase [Desulfonatronovibrio magnus]|uniref:deoxyribodipyrimidine photo-lyase n=1 Tax=Desulfonatronovibrio magnus TaxID=698827 RepID=UPI0005EB0B1F|nr:deoxyribodipyrimidine photo-lyase [Desulfonatronovibrio magnus]
MTVNTKRIKVLKSGSLKKGPVVYWMSRDQRIFHNWALVHTLDLALRHNSRPRIVFCISPNFLNACLRQYDFMLKGLAECIDVAHELNIPLDIIHGHPGEVIPDYINTHKASTLIMDFDPLKIKKDWQREVVDQINLDVHIVDAHNIVPCWITSAKQEYAARTIRPKIHSLLDEFLEPFPEILPWPEKTTLSAISTDRILQEIKLDRDIRPVDWILPGWNKALKILDKFITHDLNHYHLKRNDPNENALSNLSPYLHFGQICSQTIALRVKENLTTDIDARDAFLEELIVRKELSDNFCYYNDNYDNFEGIPDWGKKTLNKHRGDSREYIYSLENFEQAQTHDPLWNAAQMEMRLQGKMHGYMRMYWAKKILEWTECPEQAIEWSIYLNDKYELDGRDPNGYTGILWSTGGLHDRPWKERPVFGTIRYMNYNGCKRKFDVDSYIKKWTN